MRRAPILLLALRASVFCLLWSAPNAGAAGGVHPAFFHYTTDDGLPSAECYEILQDRRGYIWISGDNGLSRFDGLEFRNYGTEEGLLDKTILIMHEDHRGWIWLSTFSGNFYILRGDTIAPYAHNDVIQKVRNQFYSVKDFAVDSLGNLHAGLSLYAVLKISPSGEATTLGKDLNVAQGIYWVEDYPLAYAPEGNSFTDQLSVRHDLFSSFDAERIYNSIPFPRWPVTETKRKEHQSTSLEVWKLDEICVAQMLNRLFFWRDHQLLEYGTFPDGPINQLVKTKTGQIYLSTTTLQGVSVYDDLDALRANRPSRHFLDNFTVCHIYEDRAGGIWFATLEDGVFYAPSPRTETLLTDEVRREDRFIGHLSALNAHEAIVFNRQNEYLRLNTDGTHTPWVAYPYPYPVGFSYFQPAHDLLIAGSILQYKQLDEPGWRAPVTEPPNKKIHCKSISPAARSNNDLWFSSYQQSLAVIGKLSTRDREIVLAEQYFLPDRGRIHSVAEVEDRLALGDRRHVYYFDPATQTITLIPALDTLNSRVDQLLYTRSRKLVIATRGQGLGVFDPATDSLRLFSRADRLLSNSIRTIVEDRYGQIWVGSRNGVNKITLGDSVRIKSYTIADGLAANDVLDLDEWGERMAVTTKQGITLLNLRETAVNATAPALYTRAFLNGEPVDLARKSVFTYRENSLRFVLSYLSYSHRGDLTYRYRLRPEDPWTVTDNREIILSSLPPGEYLLEVEISELGVAFERRQRFAFTITPPFWQRTGVIITAVLVVIAVTAILIGGYIDRLRRESEKIKLDEEINHLRRQAYQAQMNPHFIFNCLNTIQGMVIGQELERDAAVRMIANFSSLIRSALEAAREESVSLKDEVALLRNYLALERIRFDRHFEFTIEVDPELEPEWVRLPPMLVQPFVENAVLHGMQDKTSGGLIAVSYRRVGDELFVTVQDNGPGISVTRARKADRGGKASHKSLGMTITRRRLEMLNPAGYEISTQEPRDEHGNISGTLITIRIPIAS